MIKLAEILEEYKLVSGSKSHYKLHSLILAGYRELTFMTPVASVAIRVKYLQISASGTVDMPEDYVSYSKVGVNYGGRLWTLTVNKDMLPPTNTVECGVPKEEAIARASEINNAWGLSPHYDKNGRYVGKEYTLGGGWNSQGYFKEDLANRRFLLDTVKGEIVLEYISDKVSIDTLVPSECSEALQAWLHYKEMLFDKRAGQGEKAMLGRVWVDQLERVKQIRNPFRIDEFLDAAYTDNYQGLKR